MEVDLDWEFVFAAIGEERFDSAEQSSTSSQVKKTKLLKDTACAHGQI